MCLRVTTQQTCVYVARANTRHKSCARAQREIGQLSPEARCRAIRKTVSRKVSVAERWSVVSYMPLLTSPPPNSQSVEPSNGCITLVRFFDKQK